MDNLPLLCAIAVLCLGLCFIASILHDRRCVAFAEGMLQKGPQPGDVWVRRRDGRVVARYIIGQTDTDTGGWRDCDVAFAETGWAHETGWFFPAGYFDDPMVFNIESRGGVDVIEWMHSRAGLPIPPRWRRILCGKGWGRK